jgi:hypothetical protein
LKILEYFTRSYIYYAAFILIIKIGGMMVKRRPNGLVLCPKVLELLVYMLCNYKKQHIVKFRIRFCNQPTFFRIQALTAAVMESCFLGYNTVQSAESPPTFHSNMLPLSSRPTNKRSKNSVAEPAGNTFFQNVADFQQLTWHYIPEDRNLQQIF